MGFYGNITNTSNTTFQFDKIYPNRLSMDANANNDGIFIGRYVLVEYDQNTAYPVVFIKDDKFYSSPNFETIARIQFGQGADQIYLNDIVQNQEENTIRYYKCIGSTTETVNEKQIIYARFEIIDSKPSDRTNYITNYQIDENHYYDITNYTEISFKGYDSTVWVKTTINTDDGLITKYVNIADMNSVVPTFAVVADAPTMNPITPHFDADSTNVYYKLHMQSPYGFRVAASEGESDEQITWTTTTYNKETNTTTTSTTEPFAGDIYYNKAGFDPKTVSKVTDNNYIKLAPTAKSGAIYSHGQETNDIQEFRLHLPAIGNMMSDAWDIIHGPKRDDARTDENGSLQGRLDSFKEMEDNSIPIKRKDDGTFVGTRINGNQLRIVPNQGILNEELSTDFNTDDAWIRTEINTQNLDNVTKLSGISIHHTFHSKENTTSSSNKNTDNVASVNNFDKIELYTPYVDAAGHVVGKNIETVTLPYGYKTIAVNNSNAVTAAAVSTDGKTQTADNTQDTIQFNASNKWIKLEAETEDTIKFGHLLKTVTPTTSEATLSNETSAQVTFEVYNDSFDEAGHHNGRDTKTITMPFGYGVITGDSGSTSASATFDTLAINADDAWIATNVTQDKVNITHTGPVVSNFTAKSNITNPQFGSEFTIEDWYFDEKGHKHSGGTHTIQFPKGSLNENLTATGSSVLTGISMIPETGSIVQTNANVGTLALTGFIDDTDTNGKALQISSTSSINTAFKTIQNYINNLDYGDESTTKFISKITQTDGKIAVERAAAGTLQLGIASTDGTIPSDSSLSNAFNITNKRIKEEEEALAKEVQDRKDAIDALTGTKDYSEHFDTMKEIADWLDTNKDGVVDITLDIANNTKAIQQLNGDDTTTGSVANSIKTKIEKLNQEDSAEDGKYVSAVSEANGIIKVTRADLPTYTLTSGTKNGTIKLNNGNDVAVKGLKSAAFTDSTAYATAEQGDLAASAIQSTTEFTYQEEVTETNEETGEITVITPEEKVTINGLIAKIKDLEAEILLLKGYHNSEA